MLEPLTPPTPEQERALLQPLAARLIWWQSPEQSLRQPDRVIAQVMEHQPAGWISGPPARSSGRQDH